MFQSPVQSARATERNAPDPTAILKVITRDIVIALILILYLQYLQTIYSMIIVCTVSYLSHHVRGVPPKACEILRQERLFRVKSPGAIHLDTFCSTKEDQTNLQCETEKIIYRVACQLKQGNVLSVTLPGQECIQTDNTRRVSMRIGHSSRCGTSLLFT